jgi:branched-chain amino acid transport system permease protein
MGDQPAANALASSALDAQIFEDQVRPRITPELVEEHRASPIGFHSLELERVLVYMRRQPQVGKFVIVCTRPDTEWAIGELSGVRGIGPKIVDDERFASLPSAEHGVFLRRLKALGFEA